MATSEFGANEAGSERVPPAVRLALFAAAALLFLALFHRPIFQAENFIYRDAGHFYHPYFRIQVDQWRDGRAPLWNPYENGGEPLAANPTASVFYPLKLLFLLPYPTAYKWYLMGHTALACAACCAAARGMGVSPAGSTLAGIAYAFSGFVFFQLYNIVYLVGAAWLPLGLLATDRLVRGPTVGWSLALGVVLALQILGGDPQTAQLTCVFAAGYLLIYHLGPVRGGAVFAALLAIGAGIVHVFSPLGSVLRGLLQSSLAAADLGAALAQAESWFRERPVAVGAGAAAGLAGGAALWKMRRFWGRGPAGRAAAYLVAGSLAAGGLAAVQILPTLEFAARTGRASPDAPEETAAFSLHPARLVELVVPAAFGRMFPENSRWFPFARQERSVWTPTIYMGLAAIGFAGAGASLGRSGGRRTWLTWLAIAALWMSFGKFGGVRWMWNENALGARDPLTVERGVRLHGENDGLYWLAEQTVPGFGQFRYPSKLLVFTTCAVALLAGMGLDRFRTPSWRPAAAWGGAAVCFGALTAAVWLGSGRIAGWMEAFGRGSRTYGPFQPELAERLSLASSLHAFAIAGLTAAGAVGLAPVVRRGTWFGAVVVAATGLDLFLANRWLVLTDRQEAIDAPSRVLAAIAEDARAKGFAAPFRIYRTRMYDPPRFAKESSPDRVRESIGWERATALAKYGIAEGFSYAKTEGTMTLFDVDFFFAPWLVSTPAELRGAAEGAPDRMVYYPKNGLDLWGARYFILPRRLVLDDVDLGTFTLLFDRGGRPLPTTAESPPDREDYVVVENTEAFPRAWIVREVEALPPIRDMRRGERAARMERLLYRSRDAGLRLWEGRPHGDYPLRRRAMVEASGSDVEEIEGALASARKTEGDADRVEVELYEPDRVRLRARSAGGGLCVLADVDYPGWTAKVDGRPAKIFRTNGAMRGVLVPAGEHVVEYRFRSRSFEAGAWISVVSVVAAFAAFGRRWMRR
jgi:hypothetical protein